MMGLDKFVKFMINPKNKNYSFIAVTKQSKSKKKQMNIALKQIFSPNTTFYNQKHQDKQLRLSYISPDVQEINNFKHKLSAYLNRSPYMNKQLLQPNQKSDIHPMTQTFKTGNKYNVVSINRWYSQGGQKKRNIKQYICELSHQKRANKTVESDPPGMKQQLYKSNQFVIIRKLKHPKEKRDPTKKQADNIFQYRNIPIHHTQVHFFSKEKAQTEPTQYFADISTSQKQKEPETDEKKKVDSEQKKSTRVQQKRKVTVSRIFRLREQLNLKKVQKITQQAANQLLIINEIHPTVAIITTRKNQTKNPPSQDRQIRISSKNNQPKTIRTKEEDEISPWKRRNQNQFEFF